MSRSVVSLDHLLPEAKLCILRGVCSDAIRLPVPTLRALILASRDWYRLSAAFDIFPFASTLRCTLLTPDGPCKRSGNVWPERPPLEVHRTRDSQPLGDRDVLTFFVRTCIHLQFPGTEDMLAQLAPGISLQAWLRTVQVFRQQHFARESGSADTTGAPNPEGDSPPPVWCAAATLLPGERRRLCVVGGGCYGAELANAQTDMVEVFHHQPHVYVFDVEDRRWTEQATTGTPPPPAHTYATAHTLLGNRWTFWCGGYYGCSYNTAYALDVDAWEWHELRNTSGCSPVPRYFVASFEHHGALFAWGGRSSRESYCSDLWRLDPSRAHDDLVHCEAVGTSGDRPPAKFAATLTNCDGRFAVLFGGGQWKDGGRFISDSKVFTLGLSCFTWNLLETSGPRPPPRCQHSAVNLGGNLVLFFGGYDGICRRYMGLDDVCVLNAHSMRWMRLRRPGAAAAEERLRGRLRRGDRVRLAGMPESMPQLHGLEGVLVAPLMPSRHLWRVRLLREGMDDQLVLVRQENLEPLDPGARAAEDAAGGDGGEAGDDGDDRPEDDADDLEPDVDDDIAHVLGDQTRPPMGSPVYEGASADHQWLGGEFPCSRAGMALAAVTVDAHADRRFYIFGGARYVYQEWYGDVYEFALQGRAGSGAGGRLRAL